MRRSKPSMKCSVPISLWMNWLRPACPRISIRYGTLSLLCEPEPFSRCTEPLLCSSSSRVKSTFQASFSIRENLRELRACVSWACLRLSTTIDLKSSECVFSTESVQQEGEGRRHGRDIHRGLIWQRHPPAD